MDPASYDFTNYFEKLPLLVAILMHFQQRNKIARHVISLFAQQPVLPMYKKYGEKA